jgi:hypothetical protein
MNITLYGKYLMRYTFRSKSWTKNQLFLGRVRCRANPWNAYVRERLRAANEGQFHLLYLQDGKTLTSTIDLETGQRYRLTEYIRQHKQKLLHDYEKLSRKEKGLLASNIVTVREERMKVVRANPKGVQRDVNATFTNMEHEVSSLYQLTS